MGQFSWITQDTNEAIRESYGCKDKSLTTAYMHDNKGNVWKEERYEGYGVFGGKDYYQLLAEMNDLPVTGDVKHDRLLGIDLYFDENKGCITPNLTRHPEWKWRKEEPANDPNQGWGMDEEEDEWEYDPRLDWDLHQ